MEDFQNLLLGALWKASRWRTCKGKSHSNGTPPPCSLMGTVYCFPPSGTVQEENGGGININNTAWERRGKGKCGGHIGFQKDGERGEEGDK